MIGIVIDLGDGVIYVIFVVEGYVIGLLIKFIFIVGCDIIYFV